MPPSSISNKAKQLQPSPSTTKETKASRRQRELDQAQGSVRSRFLALPSVIIQQGQGEGAAEVFSAEESRNPNPGQPTVEMRSDATGQRLEDILATESIQLFSINDPELINLKRRFQETLTVEQQGMAKRRFDDRVARGVEGRNFQQFLDQVFLDSEIRAIMFPGLVTDPGFTVERAVRAGVMTPEQLSIVEEITRRLQRAPLP